VKFVLYYASYSYLKGHQLCPQKKELNLLRTIWGSVTNSVKFQRRILQSLCGQFPISLFITCHTALVLFLEDKMYLQFSLFLNLSKVFINESIFINVLQRFQTLRCFIMCAKKSTCRYDHQPNQNSMNQSPLLCTRTTRLPFTSINLPRNIPVEIALNVCDFMTFTGQFSLSF